jgi:hypothetical protein
LLAALLQTIELEAVPPLWNLLGTSFRARLIAYRLRRRWLLLVAQMVIQHDHEGGCSRSQLRSFRMGHESHPAIHQYEDGSALFKVAAARGV